MDHAPHLGEETIDKVQEYLGVPRSPSQTSEHPLAGAIGFRWDYWHIRERFRFAGPDGASLGPYLVGVLVWAIGLSLGGTTGYAINPARDLGPRIAHWFLPLGKKNGSGWSYAPVPIVGPLAGAALAGLFVRIVHF